VLDLRSLAAFTALHVSGSHCISLKGLTPQTADGDLFGDAQAVHWAWSGLKSLFSHDSLVELLKSAQAAKREVLVLCYDGDASRLATSMLRSRGIEASSVQGGWDGLKNVLNPAPRESKIHQAVTVSTSAVTVA
jgi:rhodanese-related sulfurtransferase